MGHLYKQFGTMKNWTSWQGWSGRSKYAPEWPEFGFRAVQRPPNWSMTHEMDQRWFPQLPLIDLSPFPDLLKHSSLYILKNINYLIMWKLSISLILTLATNLGQLRHFLNGIVIFHTPPQVGGVWKITILFKKCLSWPRLAAKVTCIFIQKFGLKILKPSETSKYHSGGQKNPKLVQKLSIFDFPSWRDHRKTCFSAPKGTIEYHTELNLQICNYAQKTTHLSQN